jgi:mono/diheme cytochrome c family protein
VCPAAAAAAAAAAGEVAPAGVGGGENPAGAAGAPALVVYERDVRPVLKAHCFHCHGEDGTREGGLDVRLRRLIVEAGGKSGPAVVPGKPDESRLYQLVRDGEMPRGDDEKRLPEADVLTIRRWIEGGAATLRPEPAEVPAVMITEEERSFWAFQPVKRPAVPPVPQGVAARTPVDAFLHAKLAEHGLTFSPEADRPTLIRRATFDLLGLPPTPEEVTTFLADGAPDAYERLIDRLLADPRYGERWGRHWLDTAGYAESDGATEADTPRPFAYKYRDYVVRAFNADKPMDEFVREQLAGDEMAPPPHKYMDAAAAERLAATGFLRMAPDGTETENTKVNRNQAVAETIKVVSTTLLGMTVGCAQCHDHRYDAIPHVDYTRLRAVFDPAFDLEGWRVPSQQLVYLTTPEQEKAAADLEAEAVKLNAEIDAKVKAALDRIFERELAKVPEDRREAVKAARNTPHGQRTPEHLAVLREFPSADVTFALDLYEPETHAKLQKEREGVAAIRAKKPPPDAVVATTEVPGRVPASRLFFRGDVEQPKQEVAPGELTVLALHRPSADVPPKDPALPTTGRRLAYAKLLTDGTHPLVGRVLVNRVWMHHFGRGIVATPGDFGIQGDRPTHPELLDWLASELVDGGWRLKRLHKLVMTSAAYRQTSRRNPAHDAVDPENRLLARQNLRRMEAEAIRDSMLAVSGRLNPKMFGPSIPVGEDADGRIVIGREQRDANGQATGVADAGDEQFRRSLYVQVRRKQPLAMLDTFDMPQMTPNCDARRASTVAPQSLMFMNDGSVLGHAEAVARRLTRDAPGDEGAQVRRAWALLFVAEPAEGDVAAAKAFLADQRRAFEARKPADPAAAAAFDPQLQALTVLCQAMMSSNRFLYVD